MATKTVTPKKDSTAKATAKTTVKTPAKKAPAKTAKATVKVKETKENKTRKARVATEKVSPVIASITGLINDPNTSVEDLKSLRLYLRKAVKDTRKVVNTRKVSTSTEAKA